MNRIIKFRAWDKKRRFFHYGLGNVCMSLGGQLMWQFGFSAPDILDENECDNYVLQQYIGLKDINDKEIYDGDIIKGLQLDNDEPDICPIVWWAPTLQWAAFYPADASVDWRKIDGFNGLHHFYEIEVIGNIYENSELLG